MATPTIMHGGGGVAQADDVSDNEHTPSLSALSCTQCRHRKVKCDRKHPCDPCTRKQIQCSFPAGFKQREKRRHTLISVPFESKIDEIARKLDRISMAVDSISTRPSLSSYTTTPQPSSALTPSSEHDSSSELEGDLSLNAHAAFATDYVQRAVTGTANVSHEVTSGLVALRAALDSRTSSQEPSQDSSVPITQLIDPQATVNGISLPALDLTMAYLQKLKASERIMFFWCFNLESVGHFMEYVLAVYSGQPTIAQLLITNMGLYSLFSIASGEETSPSVKEDLMAQTKTCNNNVEFILRRLPFDLPSTFDNALALTQLAAFYLEQCKPLLAWKYIVVAAQMCLTLGYHRKRPVAFETHEQKRRRIRLVWFAVMIDKILSLRLGRHSTFREGDLALERFQDADASVTMLPATPKYVEWSLHQGRIYEQVFSPDALKEPESVRVERARALAVQLQAIFDTMDRGEMLHMEARRRAFGETVSDLLWRADKVCHLSTLCLIYRGIPADPISGSAFSEECVTKAHEALEEHQQCIVLLRKVEPHVVELYMQWSILCSPFVPFIVLFCRVFETCDSVDAAKLGSVIEALQLMPLGSLPSAYGKQLRLFKLMYDVVCRFIDAKKKSCDSGRADVGRPMSAADLDMLTKPMCSSQTKVQQDGIAEDFGPRLNEIVFETDGADMMDLEALMPFIETEGLDLGGWFDQNQQMMRFMEDNF